MTRKKSSRKVKPSTIIADDPDNMKGELKAIGGSRDEHGHVGFQEGDDRQEIQWFDLRLRDLLSGMEGQADRRVAAASNQVVASS